MKNIQVQGSQFAILKVGYDKVEWDPFHVRHPLTP